MNRYLCIHGHFYQPPRENPWLEEVELQESALPYHDWNARITAECYARNGASRILNEHGYIVEIINNYSRISFNVGPTLLSWMEKEDPDAYRSIIEADRISRQRFSGHGSALAQVYNHMIMPLANARDKRTQVLWGIRDFEHRFGARPEGMWLAETAVDLESLDIMAEQGIKFTVLAPHQAKRVKRISEEREWTPDDAKHIDLKRPYLCRLPSGRTIALFFYDGPVSRSVAFEGLLHSGESLARRLVGAFDLKSGDNQLVHIATDGESYGHHHKFGDMALAYCLHYIESNGLANVTIYGEYLERNPPEYEAEIVENSSWSCAHGIERWRDDCGCNSGMNPGWNQAWRGPLRKSLDWLRDRSAEIFEKEMEGFAADPWALRDAYIEVILDRSRYNLDRFLAQRMQKVLTPLDKNKVLRCLEIQRNALLMYTSCGWFFDDISGIETVQIIKYAARVIQLIRRVTGEDLEQQFVELLGKAKSNVSVANNGARIYKSYVEPSIVDILRVGAHYGMSSLYHEYPRDARLYCFTVHRQAYDKHAVGKLELVLGRADIVSEITLTSFQVQFAVLHLGDQNFICGVDYFHDEDGYHKMHVDVAAAFAQGDIPLSIQAINRYFGAKNYSLRHLFKHEQQTILDQIFDSTMQELELSFRQIYDDHFSLIRMINENHLPLPKALANVVEFVLLRDLTKLLSLDEVPLDRLGRLVKEINRWQFKRDKEQLDFLGAEKVGGLIVRLGKNPDDVELLEYIVEMIRLFNALRLELDIWKAQNIYYAIGQEVYRKRLALNDKDAATGRWLAAFESLGEILKVKIV
ncbi:MAG: DUF3536 domain-containing protein [Candidatus Omnitrophica bacterium]|nr:DUF3536 domain-containing protein [Candidatus Omnitrophota bacterium]